MKTELPVTGQIHDTQDITYSMSSGHRAQSMHTWQSDRHRWILTINTTDWTVPGSTGADEQAPVLREIQKWNAAKGVTPVELVPDPAFRGYGSIVSIQTTPSPCSHCIQEWWSNI